ncbi:hypothetical protein [Tychonema bourrellyi]|uniref:hypothetical protein n=1 Tax=Tychonema bourrellyi TaxID=54313 RepID=UPI00117E9BBE|nr:hypothetical protein [Tychonema bourrellyi]
MRKFRFEYTAEGRRKKEEKRKKKEEGLSCLVKVSIFRSLTSQKLSGCGYLPDRTSRQTQKFPNPMLVCQYLNYASVGKR